MQRRPAGILPELAPACAKVGFNRGGVAAYGEGEQDQRSERERLGSGEDILDQRTQLDAEDVDDGEQDDDDDACEIGGADADLHIAQDHGTYAERGNVGDVPEPMGCRDGWEEDAEEFAEGDGDGGDGAALNDKEKRPSIEETPEWAERFAQVDILAAGPGHHRRQFAVAERGGEGENGRDHPCAKKERRGVCAAGDVGIDNEDSGANHRADDQSRR